MEVAYIFSESGNFRVPLFGYDKQLYKFFSERGGKWDQARNEFILAGNTNARVSEVIRLKRQDIDMERKTVLINQAKGRKDRYCD